MKRFDWTVALGAAVGLTAIIGAAWIEGLNLGFLWHSTAALIVGGGTLGALIVRRGIGGVTGAMRAVWDLRLQEDDSGHNVEIAQLAWLARSAHKTGVKAFESYAETSGDALVSQGLILVAECAEPEHIKQVLTRRINFEDNQGLQDSITLDAAGGFAPTFGILGAVLGLIGVLRVLDKPELLGVGIGTAFVATIYGIGLANLLFFPLAARIRARHEARMTRREELATVIVSLAANEKPRAIINQFNLPK